jgi:CIC family chloride channel protein
MSLAYREIPIQFFSNSIFSQNSQAIFFVIILFMAALVLLKVIASSSTNGAGGVGGIFAPTLFIGGINGYLVAE